MRRARFTGSVSAAVFLLVLHIRAQNQSHALLSTTYFDNLLFRIHETCTRHPKLLHCWLNAKNLDFDVDFALAFDVDFVFGFVAGALGVRLLSVGTAAAWQASKHTHRKHIVKIAIMDSQKIQLQFIALTFVVGCQTRESSACARGQLLCFETLELR